MKTRMMYLKKQNLSWLAFFLVIFGLLDAVFTDFGLRYSFIRESNPIMRLAYETGIPLFYLIKIGLPLVFLYLSTMLEPQRYLQLFASLALVLYMTVFFMHVFWMLVTFTI